MPDQGKKKGWFNYDGYDTKLNIQCTFKIHGKYRGKKLPKFIATC